MNKRVLIIDNNDELVRLLSHYLTTAKFEVSHEHDGEQGIKRALNQKFDIIILSLVLPTNSGYQVLKTIREHLTTPVLILTEHQDTVDKLVSFELGADDYLVKPCSPYEVILRLESLLKRIQDTPSAKAVVTYEAIQLDSIKRVVYINGNELELTNTEFNILEMLSKIPGQAFSKEELTEYALSRKYTAYDRSIDVHISNLRNKLGNNSLGEPWLKTVRGFGYLFNA